MKVLRHYATSAGVIATLQYEARPTGHRVTAFSSTEPQTWSHDSIDDARNRWRLLAADLTAKGFRPVVR